tara:strand:- start:487 stop:705 length:219 start_codon:yes stop_codon:yes gene_type:complete
MNYDQYLRFKELDIDDIMHKLYCTSSYAIGIVNECKRIHNIEYGNIGKSVSTTVPWINAAIEKAEVSHYEGD